MSKKTIYRLINYLILSTIGFSCAPSQQLEEGKLTIGQLEVKSTIEQLFQSMYDGDSITAQSIFIDSARLYTIYVQNDSTVIKEGKLHQLIHAIGTPHKIKWIEKSWNYKISIDGSFAQAWCNYAFFAGERFSHCGVDAFHLVKKEDVWRIFSLADTRRKESCIFPTNEYSEPK